MLVFAVFFVFVLWLNDKRTARELVRLIAYGTLVLTTLSLILSTALSTIALIRREAA